MAGYFSYTCQENADLLRSDSGSNLEVRLCERLFECFVD
jgi:hypothetical protein